MEPADQKAWLSAAGEELSAVLAQACHAALESLSTDSRFEFDVEEGLCEVGGKVGQGEFVRDRPVSGLLSAMYEGPARWAAALEAMVSQTKEVDGGHVKILDLGFGTAAPAVAAAVVASNWGSFSSHPCPTFQVHTIDSSPFVLDFIRDHLWPRVEAHFSGATSVELVLDHNTCILDADAEDEGVWVFAGYLFDHVNHREGFIREFTESMELRQPAKAWIAGPARSMNGVAGLRDELRGAGYRTSMMELTSLVGGVSGILDLHRRLLRSTEAPIKRLNPPSWSEPEVFCAHCLFEGSRQLTLGEEGGKPWDMYTPKLRERRLVKLNERQKEAAVWSGKVRPTCISGPAGSGKSLVLTERLSNLVKKPPRELKMTPYDPGFRILFTTFNKELSSELRGWIGEVLGDKAEWKDGGFRFEGSHAPNIRLLHFDVLPTRIGDYGGKGTRLLGGHTAIAIEGIVNRVRDELKLRPSEHKDILHPDFIEEEFNRVFYGMELTSLKEYQTVTRKGRGQKGGGPEQRRIVGKVMGEWMKHCFEEQSFTFHMVRRMFLNELKEGRYGPMFTDIFVDEFQDCTPADFSIFYRLLHDSNRLIVAGDLAQSVHLGSTADMPRDRLEEGEDQRYFRRIFLKGSYRLPLHISLCIQGLSEAIQQKQKEGEMMSPYEGAPPGVRMLFVSAESTEDMAAKIAALMTTYAPYRERLLREGADERAVIMESDKELAKAISMLKPNSIMSDTILRLKGLEKSMVIWSTRALYQSEDDAQEFVYTILTRSSGLAVIAHFEGQTPDAYGTVLNTLDQELLLPWDAQSQKVLHEMKTEITDTDELIF
jgi:DNA helicase-2/ATP-dependent DNA helicase PcrA